MKVIQKKRKMKVDPYVLQKKIWIAGHYICLICGILYGITYLYRCLFFWKYRNWKFLFLTLNKNYSLIKGTRWYHSILRHLPTIWYKFALIGTIVSGVITLWQDGINSATTSWNDLLGNFTFQYIGIAILWIITNTQSAFKIIPFIIISYIHIINKKDELNGIDVQNFDDLSMKNKHLLHILSYMEIALLFIMLLDTLFLKKGTSGFLFVLYLGFFWIRLNFATYLQISCLRLLKKLDDKVPQKYKKIVNILNRFIFFKYKNMIQSTQIDKKLQ